MCAWYKARQSFLRHHQKQRRPTKSRRGLSLPYLTMSAWDRTHENPISWVTL